MVDEWPLCPVCGDQLFAYEGMDEKTGEMKVLIKCDIPDFVLEISTGLSGEDIAGFHEEGKPIRKEMIIKLLRRAPYTE